MTRSTTSPAPRENGSRSRSFVYDSVSRLLTSNNPEIASPSTGSACPITYTYDGDNNLATKVYSRSE